MYHMLPYAYRPQANYSRAQHGEFQNLIEGYVNIIQRETDIVDAENPNGRKLFNSIDTFFSYGLLTRDGTYWRCIREFLPRAEQKMLVAECGNANDRFLSIGWLKTSFNKGTLHFMLLALNNQDNKRYLKKFYHVNACIRNSGLLEAITQNIGQLQHVQFAFYSTRQLRAEPAVAAVVETTSVQISSRAAARQRKLTEKEASQDTVPNIIPTEIPTILSQAIDQDVLLDELVRNRHNRINTELYDSQHQGDDVDGPSEEPVEEEQLVDVMTKKMSYAHMDSIEPVGIEQILASVEPAEPAAPVYNLADGEYEMSQGDVLQLAIDVFDQYSEKIIECFKVIENFHTSHIALRYFVVTNFNIYVFKYRPLEPNASPPAKTNLSSDGFFIPVVRIPHDRIKTIRISIDNLSFMIDAVDEGFSFYHLNTVKEDQIIMSYGGSMAGLESGAHMMNSLIMVVQHSALKLPNPPEVDDHIGYMCMLQPNLEKQLGRSIDIRSAALCFWHEQTFEDREVSLATKAGYLFKTTVGSWMKSTEEAEQKYCMIIGNDFYMFNDSNCKGKNTVIKLRDTTVTSTGRVNFQLKTHDGSLEFECTTQEDHTDWMRVLTIIIEDKSPEQFISACLAVLTENSIALVQEGEKFWTDGFLRLLTEIKIESLKQVIVVYPPEDKESFFANQSPLLCFVTQTDTIHYLFIRFSKELERVATALESNYGLPYVTFSEEFALTPVGKTIQNACCASKVVWPM
uniref:PH domain-containing protein n=1 Tax=Caenorhabditis tropicalis TaxID=1561998 RepID=A0A1I7T9P9_9PELO